MNSASEKTSATDSGVSLFCCDHCDYEMPVKSDLAGRRAKCPKCGQIGRVGSKPHVENSPSINGTRIKPSVINPEPYGLKENDDPRNGVYIPGTPTSAPTGKMVRRNAEPTTRCPFCREEILAAARKCKHCGEYLDETLRQLMEHERPAHAHGQPSVGGIPRRTILLAAAIIVVVSLGTAAWLAIRGGGFSASGQAAATTSAKAAPTLEPVVAAMRKGLEGMEIKDVGGSVTRFLSASEGGAWLFSVRKSDVAGNPAHAFIEVPYRMTSPNAKIVSSRGKLVLDFANHGEAWKFQAASRQMCFATTTGGEHELPEDDQQLVRLGDQDYVLRHIKGVVQKASQSKDD